MVYKRSLTIIELLIVIALLAAMASMIVPLIADSLSERAFVSAADVTGEQLVLARAHAQATGEPVEVRYDAASSHVEARRLMPWAPGSEPWPLNGIGRVASSGSASNGPSIDGGEDADSTSSVITEPWASRALTDGVRIFSQRPASGTDNGTSADAEGVGVLAQLGLPGDSGSDIRLAVFMPDGSALMGAPVWFNDQDGRIGKLTINPWTGLPVFERVIESDGSKDVEEPAMDRPETTELNGSSPTSGDSTGQPRAGKPTKNPRR